MIKLTRYKCEYCHRTYDQEEYCVECGKRCIERREKLKDISTRIRTLSPNHYIYDAKDLDDVENLFATRFHGYADDYDYEDFKYPCKLIIFEYDEQEPYEDYYETYYNVKQLDEYIDVLISAR